MGVESEVPRRHLPFCSRIFVLTFVLLITALGEVGVHGVDEKNKTRRLLPAASFLGPAVAPCDQEVFLPFAFYSVNFLESRQTPQTQTSAAGKQLTPGYPPVETSPTPPPAAPQESTQQTASKPSAANALPVAVAPSLTAEPTSVQGSVAPQQQPLNAVPPAPPPATTITKASLVPIAFRSAASAPVSPQPSPVSSSVAASSEPRGIVQRASTPAATSQQAATPPQAGAAGSSAISPLSRCYPCVDAARLGASSSSSLIPQDLLIEAQGRLEKSESHIAWIVLLGATIVCFFLLAVGVLWVASAYFSLNLGRPNKSAAAQASASAAPSRNRQRPDFDFNARSLRSPSRRFDSPPQQSRPYSSSPSLSIRPTSPPGGASNA
ncbi:hypothetical protein ACSSS7_002491 [Eimeria intestinalis]